MGGNGLSVCLPLIELRIELLNKMRTGVVETVKPHSFRACGFRTHPK